MLIGIEMNAVERTDGSDGRRVEILAAKFGSHLPVGFSETSRSLLGAAKSFRGVTTLSSANARRANYQDRRHWHSLFDGRSPDLANQRADALRGGPGIVMRMAELKIVRSEHQDDERQRRMALDALPQTDETVPARFERIFPYCPAAVQTIFHNAYPLAGGVQCVFKDARP